MGQEASREHNQYAESYNNWLTSQGKLKFSDQPVEEIYSLKNGKKLGEGAFGTVWQGRHRKEDEFRAIKKLSKEKLSSMRIRREEVLLEVQLLRACVHKNVVRSYEAFETGKEFFFAMELCDGGDLQNRITKGSTISEDTSAIWMRQVLEAIAYLHSDARRICHRDIKPHNFMFRGEMLKLGDFGIAIVMPKDDQLLTRKIGSPAFMAPEVHLLPSKSKGYDLKVDIWSAGVVMVFLLSAQCCFVDNAGNLLKNEIIQGNIPFWEDNKYSGLFRGSKFEGGPSQQARILVRALLQPDRHKRLTARGAVNHSWFMAQTSGTLIPVSDAAPLLSAVDFETETTLEFNVLDYAKTIANDRFRRLTESFHFLSPQEAASPSNDVIHFSSQQLQDVYEIVEEETLGVGVFGAVWKARRYDSDDVRAIILIEKDKLVEVNVHRQKVLEEIQMMKKCCHKNIVSSFESFENAKQFHFIVDYCDGGTLLQRIESDEHCDSSQDVIYANCAQWIRQVIESLVYLHSSPRNICHRNIKPINFMFRGEMLKLGDFSLATKLERRQSENQTFDFSNDSSRRPGFKKEEFVLLRDRVGEFSYRAPEMHRLPEYSRGYEFKVDVWAAGITMCMILDRGQHPFLLPNSVTNEVNLRALLKAEIDYLDPPSFLATVMSTVLPRALQPVLRTSVGPMTSMLTKHWLLGASLQLPSVIRTVAQSMLTEDRHERCTARQVLALPWFQPEHG